MEKEICIICHKEFTKTKRNQKYCSKECSEIAEKREADKLGLSYGQYMAKRRMEA